MKVCCIANVAKAELAVHCGADAIGLVARMPSGPGTIDDDSISAAHPDQPLRGLDVARAGVGRARATVTP